MKILEGSLYIGCPFTFGGMLYAKAVRRNRCCTA